MRCVTSDLSFQANLRARELFGLPAVACEGSCLPFADESFDVVTCCEVLEHVTHPVAVIAEALRVARRYVLLTTEEICRSPRERELRASLVRSKPHAELNFFAPEDFQTVLGKDVTIERQGIITRRCAWLEAVGEEPATDEIKRLLLRMTRPSPPDSRDLEVEFGLLLVKARDQVLPIIGSEGDDGALLDAMLAETVDRAWSAQPKCEATDPLLRDRLACPACRRLLADDPAGFRCTSCDRVFEVEQGIPVMYLEAEAERPMMADCSRWPWITDQAKSLGAMLATRHPEPGPVLRYLLKAELFCLRVLCRLRQGQSAAAIHRACKLRVLRARAACHRRRTCTP